MHRLNVGLVGFGFAGSVFHAPLISAEPRMKLAAVSTSRHLPPEFADARIIRDPYELVVADDLDLVVIAAPNEAHAPLAMAALNAGKHVVVDKPFTIDLPEAESLVCLAAKKDRILSVFQNRRWDSHFLTVRRLLEQPVIGRVTFCEIHYDRFRPVPKGGWREAEGPGSGLLYDLGPHVIDQAICLFGMPTSVINDITVQREGVAAADYFHIQLLYGKRLRVILHASCVVLSEGPRIAVHGDGGSIIQTGFDGQEAELKAGLRPGQSGWGETGNVKVSVETESGRTHVATERGAYECYYRSVAAAILDGQPLDVTPDQALDVMRIIEASRASAAGGLRIDLSDAEQS